MADSGARRRRVAAGLLAVALATPAAASGSRRELCAAAGASTAGPRVAVLSAFPAELAPLVAAAEVETTVEADGRRYYTGRLDGVRVVLGLTGIGLVNAARTTDSVIRKFTPAGIVMSAVAGSRPHRIADVVVPAEWREQSGGDSVAVNPALLEIVRRGAAALPEPLHNCTPVPPTSPNATTVCLPFDPAVIFAQLGESSDPYNGQPFPCAPGGGEILGCELPAPATAGVTAHPAATDAEAQDMETAAVARVAAQHRVPFVAMRAVSDGAGDPLGDRGFPAQFFDYYRLAADNAGIVTRAFLTELDRLAGDRSARRICRLLAHHRWRRAAERLRAGRPGA